MAKTLSIRVPAGQDNPDPVDALIVPPSVTRSNLGSLLMSILDATTEKLCVFVDFEQRKISAKVSEGGFNPFALMLAADGAGPLQTIEQVTPGRSSVIMDSGASGSAIVIDTDLAGPLEKLVGPTIPSVTMGSIANAVEDDLAREDERILGPGPHFLLVDQHTGKAALYTSEVPGNIRALWAAGGALAPSIVFEQIPASEEEGSAVVPFEG